MKILQKSRAFMKVFINFNHNLRFRLSKWGIGMRSIPKEVTAVENMEKVGDAGMSDKRFEKRARSTADSKQHDEAKA